MALELAINFNKNDSTVVKDYSTKGRNATTVSNLTIIAGVVGFQGDFDGTTTKLDFGNIIDLGGTSKVSVFMEIKMDAVGASNMYIARKQDQFEVFIDTSGKINFLIKTASATTLVASAALVAGTLTTVGCVYDGVKMFIYLDGTEDNNVVKTGNLAASSNDFLVGTATTAGSLWYDGKIEMLDVRGDVLSADNITALDNTPTGIKYESRNVHNLDLGDIIAHDPESGTPLLMVVTFKDSTTVVRAKPIDGKLDVLNAPIRLGNVFDSTREDVSWIDKDKIFLLLKVKKLADFSNPTGANTSWFVSETEIFIHGIDNNNINQAIAKVAGAEADIVATKPIS